MSLFSLFVGGRVADSILYFVILGDQVWPKPLEKATSPSTLLRGLETFI